MKEDSSEYNMIHTISFTSWEKVIDDEPGNLEYIKETVPEPFVHVKEPMVIKKKQKIEEPIQIIPEKSEDPFAKLSMLKNPKEGKPW